MEKKSLARMLILLVLLVGALMSGCTALEDALGTLPGGGAAQPEPAESAAPAETQIFEAPTPQPTATPGALTEAAEDLAEIIGAEEVQFLGLLVEDWIDLGISLIIILAGLLVVAPLLLLIISLIARYALTSDWQRLLEMVRPQVYWAVGTISAQYAVQRLDIIPADVKFIFDLAFFTIYVILLYVVARKVVQSLFGWYIQRQAGAGQQSTLQSLLPLAQRVINVTLFLVALIILLDRYGVNVIALTTVLGIGGLAISLAAQDTVKNVISGFIIMVDQPFRVGDRIRIAELDTWGDVQAIGARTTRIITPDNRTVIVPNSVIGSNQIVNYSLPDGTYRIEIELGLSYGIDIPRARQVIVEAVNTVDGVLTPERTDALFLKFGDSALVFRVRWWLQAYTDIWRMFDQVNQAIHDALAAAEVEIPFNIYDVNLHLAEDEASRLARTFGLRKNGS